VTLENLRLHIEDVCFSWEWHDAIEIMVRRDGNIGAWMDEEQAAIGKLSAKDIGFELVPGWEELFSQSLAGNRDAERLKRDMLPKCNVPRLAGFIVLTVSTNIEDELVSMKGKRGQRLKATLRGPARKLSAAEKPDAERILKDAGKAFDTRREGLAEHCFAVLIIRAYLHQKSGIEPNARELAALLKAGLAASGRAPFQTSIDHDLLRRNLKNFEKGWPELSQLAKEQAVELIEVSPQKQSTDKI